MNSFLKSIGQLSGVRTSLLPVDEPFIRLADRFADDPHTVCLMSGGDLDCARYHILAVKPWLILKGWGRSLEVSGCGMHHHLDSDPFELLRYLMNYYSLSKERAFPFPVASGMFGYFSYDLKDSIETLPRTSVNDLELPDIYLTAPSIIVVEDTIERKRYLHVAERTIGDKETCEADSAWFYEKCASGEPSEESRGFAGGGHGFRSNFDKATYMDAIRTIREYITAGDIYQVNMSQRFQAGFEGSPFGLFTSLYGMNPAPFFAYVNAGDHQVVSTSPERFILRDQSKVESRPIKGTRPRGNDRDTDERLKRELRSSAKDDAELSMIVDLIRNDIGKVCRGGSVAVTEHKRVEAYKNVFHLISIVEGELDDTADSIDLIRATFPGGSITGCPKIRSMEIIDELETNRRHIYTGSIGYLSFHNTMDLSIAIRTATVYNGNIVFSVGGGVVFDSDPSDEYEETLHKGQTLFNVFTGGAPSRDTRPRAWINGAVKPLEACQVPVTDLGVQYGFGFFETIRSVNGKPQFLDDHLERLKRSWVSCIDRSFPDVTWLHVIDQVLAANHLRSETAAIKIMVTRGSRDSAPFDANLIVTARPYVHRLDVLQKPGVDLMTATAPRQTPLAGHKSMNYLYYHLAGRDAQKQGGDEALILNPDGSISETNTANIFLVQGRTLIVPESDHVLPGIMAKQVKEVVTSWGYTLHCQKVFPEDLTESTQMVLTNSLMGAVPVASVDGKKLSQAGALCRDINRALL